MSKKDDGPTFIYPCECGALESRAGRPPVFSVCCDCVDDLQAQITSLLERIRLMDAVVEASKGLRAEYGRLAAEHARVQWLVGAYTTAKERWDRVNLGDSQEDGYELAMKEIARRERVLKAEGRRIIASVRRTA